MSEIFVGQTKDGINLTLPDHIRCGQVQIVGATGRGKTESVILPWLIQDTLRGRASILIDGKGDQAIYEKIKAVFAANDMDQDQLVYFDIGNIDESFATNPLKYGTSQQIVDRIFSSFQFDNSYYKSASYEACLLVAQVLGKTQKEVTFKEIYLALSEDKYFSEITGRLGSEDTCEELKRLVTKYLSQNYSGRQEKISGFISQLQPFAVGELSELLNGPKRNRKFFTLSECLCSFLNEDGATPKSVALIFIPTLLYQEAASRLGQMFLQELAWALAKKERQTSPKPFQSVFLDEFSSFVYAGFVSILNKARSTKTAFHISHQSIGDLEAVSPEFAKAVHVNTNVKCILGVNDPETSDFFAKHFGTKEAEKTTERVRKTKFFGDMERTGEMSLRATEEYKINPNRLRNYSQGMGVLSFIFDGKPVTEEIQFFRSPEF